MTRYTFDRPDPIDHNLYVLVNEEINISELQRTKSIKEILKDDIIPLFPSLSNRLSSEDLSRLIIRGVLDIKGNLLPLGKGYIAYIITHNSL